jgi:sulfide:quinone oxidoreductase
MTIRPNPGITAARRPRGRGPRVVVAGGGVAGLEALLALRALAQDRLELHLLSPGDAFVYRPLEVIEPFDPRAMVRIQWARILDDQRVSRLADALRTVDPDEHVVETAGRKTFGYDLLVLAPGARPQVTLAGAVTVGIPGAVAGLERLIAQLRAGEVRQVAFVVPPGVTWTLPIYELALLTAQRSRGADPGPDLFLVTAEQEPLDVFGPEASRLVAGLLAEQSIRLHTKSTARGDADGNVWLELEPDVPIERAVAMPQLKGPRITGLRADEDGFLEVDEHGLVAGEEDIYAAGDATAVPIKQGGLATQQADAVAAHIAARVGAPVEPISFQPVLRGMMLTGGAPQYLRRALVAAASQTQVSSESPWWPVAKIVGKYLAPYLATHVEWAGPPPRVSA